MLLFAQAESPQALLDRVVQNVAMYQRTLPRITADENIESDLLQHGLYRAHAKATATIRVYPGDNSRPLNEVRTYRTRDGKPITDATHPPVPFELTFAFSGAISNYFGAATFSCYVFTPVPEAPGSKTARFTFAIYPTPPPACTATAHAIRGSVVIDTATAQIRHIERTLLVPADGAHIATFAAVDFAPAALGDQTFWLPTLVVAESNFGKGHFRAVYSNYHRYTSSVTLLPGDGEERSTAPE